MTGALPELLSTGESTWTFCHTVMCEPDPPSCQVSVTSAVFSVILSRRVGPGEPSERSHRYAICTGGLDTWIVAFHPILAGQVPEYERGSAEIWKPVTVPGADERAARDETESGVATTTATRRI